MKAIPRLEVLAAPDVLHHDAVKKQGLDDITKNSVEVSGNYLKSANFGNTYKGRMFIQQNPRYYR